jgi:hypothetical protein
MCPALLLRLLRLPAAWLGGWAELPPFPLEGGVPEAPIPQVVLRTQLHPPVVASRLLARAMVVSP